MQIGLPFFSGGSGRLLPTLVLRSTKSVSTVHYTVPCQTRFPFVARQARRAGGSEHTSELDQILVRYDIFLPTLVKVSD